eukprot:g7812.t1
MGDVPKKVMNHTRDGTTRAWTKSTGQKSGAREEGGTAADPAADPTDEEREADLVLTELFTLGVEDDVATDSEDDQSGLAVTTSGAAVEAARADEVLQRLKGNLGDTERELVGQLQSVQAELSRETCEWLNRQAVGGSNRDYVQGLELRLAGVDERCLRMAQRESIEQNMKETVDEMISALDRHLEDSATSAKQQFRWMKRRYREKIDVNRAASRIELKDTLLLDRSILENKTKEIDDRFKEETARLRVEFQMERSSLRKKQRELEQSVEVLRLEKQQAADDAFQAHRYIEALEEGGAPHSEDGSVRSHKHSPRGRASVSPRGNSRHASRGGSAQTSRHSSNHHLFQRQESLHQKLGATAATAAAGDANSPRGGGARHHAFVGGANGSPRSPRHTHMSPRGVVVGGAASTLHGHHARGGGGVGVGSPLESARSPRGGAGSGQNTGRLAFIAGEAGRGLHNMGSGTKHINPAARHEEARIRFENDVARKLMDVIEKKKFANLQEELADEIKNREAANARLALMEEAIPKLHEDLKKVQEQLVQSRMETNELRNINTVLSNDLTRVGALERREAISNAETMLIDKSHNAGPAPRSQASFRRAAGAVVGALRFDAVASTAQQRGLWTVQQSPAEKALPRHAGGTAVDQEAVVADDGEPGLIAKLKRQITGLEQERDAAVAKAAYLQSECEDRRDEAEETDRAFTNEEALHASEELHVDKRFAAIRLELNNLKEVRRDLESKIAKMQADSDENAFLRRRLEAIERTTLKLNIGGVSSDLQTLRERLELESAEVLRLRGVVAALQQDKLALSEAAAKMQDESVPLVEVEAGRVAFERRIATVERLHQMEKSRLERDVQRLADFKAEFENLAESSLDGSESNGTGDGGAAGCGDEKWKLRVKKMQKYAKWQLAEAENQNRRERAQMALKSRAHEILMAEMAVVVKRYRRERGRLSEANRKLLGRLAEVEAQPLQSPTTYGPCSPDSGGHDDGKRDPKLNGGRSKKRERMASGSGAFRHPQRTPLPGGAVAVPTLSSVALVPVHTIESAAEVVAARRRQLVVSASAAELASSVATRAEIGGAPGGARRSANGDPASHQRPRTSTGCERHVRNKAAIGMLSVKAGDRKTRRKERDFIKMGADSLARQLRSRVRDEFFGPTSSARERIQDVSAATARHTTRDPMVLGKPLSAITGSILTNVSLPARTPTAGRETPPDRASAPKSGRAGDIEGGKGSGGCAGLF